MDRPFTEYLRSLASSGEPPAERDFRRTLRALRRLLAGEIKRRGLWERPPSYLCVPTREAWAGPGGDSKAASGPLDPLAELAAELYSYVFLDRLRSLRAQLEVKPHIEGLVALNARHFVQERQEACDPLGARVYRILRTTVREAVEAGRLFLLAGAKSIGADSVLAFSPRTSPEPEPNADFSGAVARWCDDLLPALVTALGKAQRPVRKRLAQHLRDLQCAGTRAFSFKALHEALIHQVRGRWWALGAHDEEGHETGQEGPVPVERPSQAAGLEERQSLRALDACVRASVEGSGLRRKSRQHLHTLWRYLRITGLDGAEPASHRRLGELLGIPRERLPELHQTLREIVEKCRRASS